jgi:hypothetical protein
LISEGYKTLADQVLDLFTPDRDRRPSLPPRPFAYEDVVVSTSGRAICITTPTVCSRTYEPPEKLPKPFDEVFHAAPIEQHPQTVEAAVIRDLIGSDGKDFREGSIECMNCRGSGECDDCHCESKHACGECVGEGSIPTECKKLLQIGTAPFEFDNVDRLFRAASIYGKTCVTYRGASDSNFIHHFEVGDCRIIMCSAHPGEKEIVNVPLSEVQTI